MSQITMEVATRFRARVVGVYYLLTILIGVFVLFFHGRRAFTADIIATVFYVAVTALFYDLSKALNGKKGR